MSWTAFLWRRNARDWSTPLTKHVTRRRRPYCSIALLAAEPLHLSAHEHLGTRSIAEFLGTFWLVFGGCGSAVIAAGYPELGIGFLGVALAFGLTVLSMRSGISLVGISTRRSRQGHRRGAKAIRLLAALDSAVPNASAPRDTPGYWKGLVRRRTPQGARHCVNAATKAGQRAGGREPLQPRLTQRVQKERLNGPDSRVVHQPPVMSKQRCICHLL